MTSRVLINGPSRGLYEGQQYQKECQFALEPSINRLIEVASDAGWDLQQVVYALVILTLSHIESQRDCEKETLFQ